MFNLIKWPIIGRLIRGSCEKDGEELARGLMRRGWSPVRILRYANEGISESAARQDTERMHEYIGMSREASRLRSSE